MLRRSILALSQRRLSVRRVPKQTITQISPSLCFRRDFSSVPPGPGHTSKPRSIGINLLKGLVGGVALGICVDAAYSGGYLDGVLGKRQQDNATSEKLPKQDKNQNSENVIEPLPIQTAEGSQSADKHVEETKDSTESQYSVDPHGDSDTQVQAAEVPRSSDGINEKGDEPFNSSSVEVLSKDESVGLEKSSKDTTTEGSSSGEQAHNELIEDTTKDESVGLEKSSEDTTTVGVVTAFQENILSEDQPLVVKSQIESKDTLGHEREQSPSLLHTYSLNNEADEKDPLLSEVIIKQASPKEESSRGSSEDKGDGKLILDFLQAIHAAEKRQAELDALVLAEEKRAMKDKYEKELKDARARELRYAEEAAMLEKEIKKERAKAASALKFLQEKAEEKLKMALEEKEKEKESKLKEVQEFAKAELAASIAREKAAQIERMTEANLNINALCMAFYARSEEARQTHSIHKLALGALALEDALSNGLPVQAELNALGVYIDSVDKDSLLQLAVSSLPEEVRLHGTDTVLNLNQKFNALKGSLRHFSLIPPDGGGILTHSLAHVASFLKVKEADQSGDGIESVINKVESLLAAGKLVEAANILEDGVKGSKANELVNDWVTRVRNRAIAEQALVLLQSYATSMSLN